VQRILSYVRPDRITYGWGPENILRGTLETETHEHSTFSVSFRQRDLGRFSIGLPGKHMMLNALAAIAVGLHLGCDLETMRKAIGTFRPPLLRWQIDRLPNGTRLITDFAHHPTELEALLSTARRCYGEEGRIVLVFQPILFSRTQRFQRRYADAIQLSDLARITNISGSGEANSHGTDSGIILQHLGNQQQFQWIREEHALVEDLIQLLTPADTLILASNGALESVKARLAEQMKSADLSGNSVPTEVPTDTWTDRFRHWAGVRTSAPACIQGARVMTYGQLWERVNQLGLQLQKLVPSPHQTIAAGLPLSIDQLCLQLAIMVSGHTYVAVAPHLPAKRKTMYLRKSGATMYVVEGAHDLIVDPELPSRFVSIPFSALERVEITDTASQDGSACPRHPSDAATYIMFTSGSTGDPKGIPVSGRSLNAFVSGLAERLNLSTEVRTFLNSALSFDASVAELFLTLYVGGTLVLRESQQPLLGRALTQAIRNTESNLICATPSALKALNPEEVRSLKVVIAGGEVCPQELADRFSKHLRFFNGYGPTEATVYTTIWEHQPGETVNIGYTLPHVSTYIVDEHLREVAEGQPGELCIAGPGVASAYLSDEEQTEKAFQQIRDQHGQWIRVYRTGDRVRRDPKGRHHYLGRTDHQIKLRGIRIELEEIEQKMESIDGCRHALVWLEESGPSKRLVSVWNGQETDIPDTNRFRQLLGEHLPEAMIPSGILFIEDSILNEHGKKDRTGIQNRYAVHFRKRLRSEPARDPVEKQLAAYWKQYLGVEPGLDDDFFELGGDSLSVVLLEQEIENGFGHPLPAGLITRYSSLREMAKIVRFPDQYAVQNPAQATKPSHMQIVEGVKHYMSDWTGQPMLPGGMMRIHTWNQANPTLIWCCQYGNEVGALAEELGESVNIIGIRSGHLVFDNKVSEDVNQLVECYVNEIQTMQFHQMPVLAGNCQGSFIVYKMMEHFRELGQPVPRMILMECAHQPAYEGEVHFIFGELGFLNPKTRFHNTTDPYDTAYPQGYSIHYLPGGHGTYFEKPVLHSLANVVKRIMTSEAL
jgi:amino acid adenylation domain-containing protein